jgi:hypothetical protein
MFALFVVFAGGSAEGTPRRVSNQRGNLVAGAGFEPALQGLWGLAGTELQSTRRRSYMFSIHAVEALAGFEPA